MTQNGVTAGLPFYQRAVELDPNFASAWVGHGDLYARLGEPKQASDYFQKAFQLREHVSEPKG